MGLYFTLKRIPELRDLTPAQTDFIRARCLHPVSKRLYERSLILFVITMIFLGDLVTIFYKARFGQSIGGGLVLAFFLLGALGSLSYVLIIQAMSRRAVRQFIQTSRDDLHRIATPNQQMK